jgi:hypothetical protein
VPRLVDLDDLRLELERLGFEIVSKGADQLIAIRKKLPGHRVAKMTYVVFVQSVPNLTTARIDYDQERLAREAHQLDGSRLRSPVFQKTLVVIPVYVAGTVERDAQDRCASAPMSRKHAGVHFPIAYDMTTGAASFRREARKQVEWAPMKAYEPSLVFLAQRLFEPDRAAKEEPVVDLGADTSTLYF